VNKRIRELARRAGATDEQGGRAEDVFCFTKQELDNFVEQIVKGCIGCCDIVGKIEWIETPTYDLAIDGCKLKIKQYFGVK